jgi:hypothetical protein|nr:MAG TPA_asm: hypothetical protein [Caudoviricetes sp.]
MLKINYKGYTISQASNNHVMICKDNQMVFHAQCDIKLNKEGLENVLEHYFKLNNLIEKMGG